MFGLGEDGVDGLLVLSGDGVGDPGCFAAEAAGVEALVDEVAEGGGGVIGDFTGSAGPQTGGTVPKSPQPIHGSIADG